MRKTALQAMVLAVALMTASALFAADPAKEPDGFRGVPWGARLDSLPDMEAVDTEGDVVHCDRKDEKKTLGPIATQLIDYSFYKDRFYHAAIIYERGFDVVQETLQDKYGPPDAAREKKDKDGRKYVVAEWVWPGKVYIGHRRFLDEDGGRIFYFYSPIADESMGRKGDPATAASAAAFGAGTYVVKKGDTLGAIAARHGVSLGALRAANGGLDPKKLKLGQTLAIPGAAKTKAPAPAASVEAPAEVPETASSAPADEPAPTAQTAAGASREASSDEAPRPEPAQTEPYVAAPAQDIQTPGRYAVASGDVFSAIAKRFSVSQKALARANPGVNPKKLSIGQILVIPETAKGAAPARSEAPSAAPEEKAQAGQAAPVAEAGQAGQAEQTVQAGQTVQAAPAEAPKAAAVHGKLEHVIAPGDTIGALAARYGVSEKSILRANKIKNPKTLQLGQKIVIPASTKK